MDIISVIDDDKSVRVATLDLLDSAGFACEAFESAEVYLQSGKAKLTACLILDISMPGISGLELQGRLAQDGFSMPIVFITAFPSQSARARAVTAGAICFLPKPYADEELLKCLETALNTRRRQISKDEANRMALAAWDRDTGGRSDPNAFNPRACQCGRAQSGAFLQRLQGIE
jgi:FixJ family two-component response regulator